MTREDRERTDRAFEAGVRLAHVHSLRALLVHLGYDETRTLASLILEREDAIMALRAVCEEYGDTDWSPKLHLSDIIEKHLHNHLRVPDENK